MSIRSIYESDCRHIRKWEQKYTDEEFYRINKKLRHKLEPLLGNTLTPRELYMAGMIFHHGFTLSSSRQALRLAKQSYDSGYEPAKTLIAQATDRLLQLQGKPQKFGTQAIRNEHGKLRQYKLDGSVSDNDRKEYGLPTLKELKRHLES